MATIQSAGEKYLRKQGAMKANYSAAMSAFIGRDVSSSAPVRDYGNAINANSAAKWARNLDAAFR